MKAKILIAVFLFASCFYAEAESVTNYWVKFDSNGGTGTMSNQLFTVDVEQALAPNVFTRSGYDFRGWATSSAGSVVYEDGAIVSNLTTAGSTNTLFASWIISSDLIYTQVINGVTWHYTAANGVATILNVSNGEYVSAVDTSLNGTLRIPVMIGSNKVEKIGDRAFYNCSSLIAMEISTNVTSIGDSAFFGCRGLTSVTIPNGVTSIGDEAFSGCRGLTSVTIPNGVTSIGDEAFSGCSGLTNVTIPNGVTNIGRSAFDDTPFYNNLPDGLVVFGKVAYKLKGECPSEVVIPEGVTSIAYSAFSGCSGLTSVTIPNGVTSIGDGAFSGCSGLTSVTIPNGVTSIGDGAFSGCSGLTSVTIPNGVASIGDEAFSGCNVTNLTASFVPSGMDASKLTSVTIPDGVMSIRNNAFSGCSGLTSVVIPDGVTSIGESAFSGCSGVMSIDIPLGVTTISSYAFADCTSLAPGITIPESVETMGSCVFMNCNALKIVRYWGDRPEADEALYAGAPSSLVSGALRVRSGWEMQEAEEEPVEATVPETDSSDAATDGTDAGTDTGTGDNGDDKTSTVVWHESLPASWPEGSHARRVFWLTDQPLYRVVFWGVPGINKTSSIQYYIPGRTISSLPEEEPKREGYIFLGWFTKPYGGTEVTENTAEEFVVNSSFSIYAHWQWEDDPESLSDLEYDFASAHVYDGYLLNDEGGVAGTIQLKTSKAKWDKKEEATNVTASATIMLLGEGTVRLKGSLDDSLSGSLAPTKASDERELSVSLTGSAMEGDFDSYTVVGARNLFGRKTYFDYVLSQGTEDNWKGTYVAALRAESDESSLGNGYLPLSIQVKAKGKARVAGTLPDGTKIAYSGQMEVRDGGCVLPVAVPLYSGKKGGLGFLVEFSDEDGVSVSSASEWSNTAIPFTSALTTIGAGAVSQIVSGSSFALEGGFDIEDIEIDESLLPEDVEVTVSGSKWRVPKADRVKFVKDDAAYEVQTEYGNTAGLALSFNAKTGTFRGSFKVFGVTEAGKSKKYTAAVNGVVLDGEGFGTATVKKVGAVPVTVKAE